MTRKGNAEVPQRSCLGCRATKDKDQLLRLVLTPEMEVMPDLEGKLPGRGAYVCTNFRCLTAAVAHRQFRRSFRHDVSVLPADQLVDLIRRQLHSRITGLIGLANKAGMVTGGGSLVIDSLKSKRKPGLVIIATDVSEAIGAKIIHASESADVPHRFGMTKDDFGAILGKAPKSAVAVIPGGFVVQLVRAIDRYRNFLGEV